MSTTDLAQQVADLTTATTQLTQEVVGQKARLTAAADTATGKASDASGSASAASASATSANAAAAEAETSKNQAAEIAGLDTVEEAIDLTLAKTLGLMTETEAMAQADAYGQMFDASGMVHMGKAYGSSPAEVINEGMWSLTNSTVYSNKVMFGWHTDAGLVGVSEKDFPMTYIAGTLANIYNLDPAVSSWNNTGNSSFIFPQAEAGTRVCDSTGDVRGSGEATLDFRYDPDPKYGAAPTGTEAEILREAVGRAFEGDIKNGDFRDGDVSWLKTGGTVTIDTTGADIYADSSNAQITSTSSSSTTGKHTIEVYVESITSGTVYAFYNLNGGGYSPNIILKQGWNKVTVTDWRSDGSSTALRVKCNTGSRAKVTYVAVKPSTEEVVTHRSDVATWESYDEELTGRKEIMECIQSLSTTFGDTDVPTVLSTRPNSYFDQYEGQSDDPDAQNTKYRCVVWDDLTDEQKRKVAAYMGNKLYVGENGYLVNRRLRARTFRGLGNGDWENIDVTHKGTSWDQFLSFTTSHGGVRPQGSSDSSQAYSNTSGDTYATTPLQETNNDVAHKGAFAVWSLTNQAYKGRCYLYVVASVPRANQGAYYKGLNEFGTKTFAQSGMGYGVKWNEITSNNIKTLADCFIEFVTGNAGVSPYSGSIGSTYGSGHPDGIFYDGITAGGLNGVIDWRLPAEANDTPEEQSKVQGKVENKTFRGLEKLVWSQVVVGDLPNNTTNQYFNMSDADIPEILAVGDRVWVKGNGVNTYSERTITGISTDTIALNAPTSKDASNPILVAESKTNLSVSGEFNTQMVIGDPANILQADALKDGWLGTWCPVIPDGVTHDFEFTRKALTSPVNRQYTTDNGATWTNASLTIDTVKNGYSSGHPSGWVQINNYAAYAKVTEPCENKPVYGVEFGVMNVLTSNSHEAESATFFESLLGKIPTHSGDVTYHEHLALRKVHFEDDGRLKNTDSGNRNILHEPTMLTHLIDTPALKVLPYQIAENEQCFIGYQANEMTYKSGAPTFIDGTTSQAYTKGERYRVDFGGTRAVYVCIASATFVASDLVCRADGSLINSSDLEILRPESLYGGSWGDDDKIKVTADGSDTFVDLNGNTNLSVSHKTTMPTGWTKNRARIGEQVLGIDL